MLPGRSGLEILAEMRADPAMSGVPVLMLTARGQERDREAATRAGATRFLAKPFANSDLKRCIQEMAREGAGALAGTAAPEASAMSDAVLRRSETH
jgi:DNA-binding response OmpR family regulator